MHDDHVHEMCFHRWSLVIATLVPLAVVVVVVDQAFLGVGW